MISNAFVIRWLMVELFIDSAVGHPCGVYEIGDQPHSLSPLCFEDSW